ncbi:MAG: extracellular solute-binding protein, partial [Bacillota bacterium]|nr:extracellular solute-binding protein [Bacillota bacterium]
MKKATVLILILAMLATIITGCQQSTSQSQTGSTTTTTVKPSVTTTQGETIHIVMQRPLWGNGDPASDYAKKVREAVKEAINIDVEIVGQSNPADQYEKPNLMLASGEKLDIFQVPPDAVRGWRKYKADDLIIPLNDLLQSDGPDLQEKIDELSWSFLKDEEDTIWALPDEGPAMTSCLYIRQDWLDQVNLTVPKTWEEFEAVMQAFQDECGDVGFVPLWRKAEETVFLGAFVDHLSTYADSQGKLNPVWNQEGYKDFLTKMADWYSKGYLSKEITTMDYSAASELMWGGSSGLMLNWVGGYGLSANEDNIKANVPDARITPLAPPSGPKQGKVSTGSTVAADIMITKSSVNPEAAMRYINWSMGTLDGWKTTKFGIEDTHYKFIDETKGLIEYIGEPNYAIYASTRLNAMSGTILTDLSSVDAHNFYQDSSKYPWYIPQTLGFVFDHDALKPFTDKLEGLNVEMNELYAKI